MIIITSTISIVRSDTVASLKKIWAVLGSTSTQWPSGTSWPPNWPLSSFLRWACFAFLKYNKLMDIGLYYFIGYGIPCRGIINILSNTFFVYLLITLNHIITNELFNMYVIYDKNIWIFAQCNKSVCKGFNIWESTD